MSDRFPRALCARYELRIMHRLRTTQLWNTSYLDHIQHHQMILKTKQNEENS